MIRDSLAPGSRHALCAITPGNGVLFARRKATGGRTTTTTGALVAPPAWVKLSRVGTTVTASVSTDGTTWSVVGNQSLTMGTTVFIGLAVTSRRDGTLCTATFDHVGVIGASPGNG